MLADPGDARASRMAKDFATVMSANGAPGRVIVGSTSPNGLGKALKSDLADFAIVSLDTLLSSAKGDPEWMKRAPYVARLAPETVAVIAPREVKSVSDLQGKTVSFGDLDSATSTSGRMLFSRLGVTANQTNGALSGSARPAGGWQNRRGRHARRRGIRPRSAISAPTVAFTSCPFPGHRLWSRFTPQLMSSRPTVPTLSTRPFRSKRSGNRWRSSRLTQGRDRRARMGRVGLRALSLTITMGFSAMSATRIGATSIWRPTPRGRPKRGRGLAPRKVGWMRRNLPLTDRLRRSAPRPSRRPHRRAGQARRIRIAFTRA